MFSAFYELLNPYLILTAFLAYLVKSMPIDDQNDRVGAFYYLNKYGYVPKNANELTAALMSDDVITQAVKDFQVRTDLIRGSKRSCQSSELCNSN